VEGINNLGLLTRENGDNTRIRKTREITDYLKRQVMVSKMNIFSSKICKSY
jgi:hypothetical protein